MSNQHMLSQNPILENGTYYFDFEDDSLEDYEFLIIDSIGIKYLKNGPVNGKIEWINSNLMVFYSDVSDDLTLEGLDKVFYDSFGHTCIQITQNTINKEKFSFKTTYIGQLHIIINSGTITKKLTPVPNRSVYVIGFPHRENFLAKEDRLVVGGAARPRSRGALPPGVTVFANARINKSTS